jgi:hypothetical protein
MPTSSPSARDAPTATALGLEGTLLFHLNIGYSSIEVDSRQSVLEKCYAPLLALAESRPWLRIALEASGHTLERIEALDPAWIARLRDLLDSGRVELIGSGDTQLIGPLVPAAVNRWNQALGRETYLRLLGRAPRVALVNEMAWSQGLVDAYLDAGYEALITDWNDPRRGHPEWAEEWRYRAAWTGSPSGRRIRVLWADALLFQGFQRAAMGELEPARFIETVHARAGADPRHVFVYANDAEVFDYRPGRYACEPRIGPTSEWTRIGALVDDLRARGVVLTTPERVLDDVRFAPAATVALSAAVNPIPVKKQPKYNITRWALSGWDDSGVNALCFAQARELERVGGTPLDWQRLCRAWGSDLRTHLTEKRWERFRASLVPPAPRPLADTAFVEAPLRARMVESNGTRLAVRTDGVGVVLNLRRGLALDALTLRGTGAAPVAGTLPHGHFDDIEWAADFYSGHTVLEIPGERRVTDLEAVEPEIEELAHCVRIRALVPTALGPLPKEVRVYSRRIELRYGFSAWGLRPRASLRTAALTLLDGGLGDALAVSCASGGPCERFALDAPCDHARAVSSLVSATSAFGATDGWIGIDDGRTGIEVSWPQAEAAALPLLTYRRIGAKRFVRLVLSLSEVDETHRPGALLRDFRVSIRAWRSRR